MKTLSHIVNEMKHLKLHTTVLVTLIIVAITSYVLYTDITGIKSERDINNSSISKVEFSVIESTLNDEIYKGSIQVDLLSEIVTKDILSAYPDRTELKWDLNHIDPNYKLYDIINNTISKRYINDDNVYNRVFAISHDNVISTSFSFHDNFNKGESIYTFFNKDINDIAINKIIKEKQKYAIINLNGDSPNSISDLKNMYKQDINNLKDYFLLVPSYITKDGDILGISDMNAVGETQSNNKIIIIQVMSCYDALMRQSNMLDAFSGAYNSMQMSNDYDLKLAYLRNYVLLGFILILALTSIHRYHKKYN